MSWGGEREEGKMDVHASDATLCRAGEHDTGKRLSRDEERVRESWQAG